MYSLSIKDQACFCVWLSVYRKIIRESALSKQGKYARVSMFEDVLKEQEDEDEGNLNHIRYGKCYGYKML